MTPRRVVHIVQTYVPAYRVPLFEGLRHALGTAGIDLHIVAGEPKGTQARRGDAAILDWVTVSPERTLSLGKRTVTLADTSRFWRGSAGVVLPLMGSRIDVYRALAQRRVGLKVGLWGHVRDYVANSHPLDVAAEKFQMRHADQVFAYTASGASYALEVGVRPQQVTTLHNTVDLTPLQNQISSIGTAEGLGDS